MHTTNRGMLGTTVLCVRKGGNVVMIGDGQVTQGAEIIKPNVRKVRRLGANVIGGFAGLLATAPLPINIFGTVFLNWKNLYLDCSRISHLALIDFPGMANNQDFSRTTGRGIVIVKLVTWPHVRSHKLWNKCVPHLHNLCLSLCGRRLCLWWTMEWSKGSTNSSEVKVADGFSWVL